MKNLITSFALCVLSAFAFGQNIDKAEYFWDDDPGVGNGVVIDITDGNPVSPSLTIDPTSLIAGTHYLGVRTHTDDGKWGIPEYVEIYVHEIQALEYFWNDDPGAGNGTQIPFLTTAVSVDQDFEISTAGLPPGYAILGVRYLLKGGTWSPTNYTQFNISTEYLEGEYFWDTDPGVGNATTFALPDDIDDLNVDVEFSSVGLTTGIHYLYVRVRGKQGSFGPTKRQKIYVIQQIAGGEYFWDTDPGVGNGSPLGAIVSGTSASVCGDVNTNGLSDGEHYLYVRTVTEDDIWSVPSRVQLIVTPSDVTVGCPGDLNRDGFINAADLVALLSAFGSEGTCSSDINGDLKVNAGDLVALLSVFGGTCD